MSTLRTREKSFLNFCNVKNSGMTFLWPPPHKVASTRNVTSGSPGGPPHKVASTRTVTATLFPAVKLAAEVFLFDGGALVVDLLAFG